jgi:RNA polymerase sigma-70 factor (ECF subfamily)
VEDSENVVQDTFLALFENIHKIEKDASIRYYIFTIAHNYTISLIRKRSKEVKFIEYLRSIQSDGQDSGCSEDEHKELMQKVRSIINQLPDRQREVYLLHKIDNLKYKEIAERLEISVNTVENHISRALKLIRGKIGN